MATCETSEVLLGGVPGDFSRGTPVLAHLLIGPSHMFVLFELVLYVPVNSQGHVGTLPPLYGTLTQNEDVMTSNKCFKYKPSNNAGRAYMCGWLDLEPLFLGRLRPERLTSNQIASQHHTSFAWRHKQPIYSFRCQGAG